MPAPQYMPANRNNSTGICPIQAPPPTE
jgi:hypothetical protein